MKLCSWNVNGLRALLNKNALYPFLAAHKPDILCLQEIKTQPHQVLIDLPDYTELWNPASRPGYSGTATFVRQHLASTVMKYDFSNDYRQIFTANSTDQYGDVLQEGRLQTIEFPDFYLVNVYTPNSKGDLSRLSLREHLWDPALLKLLQTLEKQKPIISCGDFNAAHTAIDLARPQDNQNNAGFTPVERQGISNLTNAPFIDTFRHLHPQTERYTWWSYRTRARERNIGWRIDYFFISPQLLPQLQAAEIHSSTLGSDHCPISINLNLG